ncbi:DNA polymerase III subunit delta [Caviibacterium pharyngocola]|uniref:DNA polymerase III subunit delta n=1 Tax=Caviibacterium pharyngocola TaxID=28159 RepID=A0A2M8RVP5_9PAST|nr:DNA polymerase III subunit delta [Caviibacterium pharyngocola]PJG82950.1 DNA polymerase III subunit delta [Caviibacterium pharyngocola]
MNRIFTEQLGDSLNNRLASVYYLVGQDPLLLAESRDAVCHSAFSQQFDEKTDITVDNSTDWNALFEGVQSMGLFFTRQIILLTLPENLTALLQDRLLELVKLLHPDVLLILQLAKLTKPMEKQEWFISANQYEPNAILVNCQTPTADQLPRWIINRAKKMSLAIDDDAVQLLCYSYENNLLALKQVLQLLALLHPDNKLTYARVKNVVEQSSVFTPYQWIDALLEGKGQRAERILAGLRAEDMQPIILLRTLQRELMTILSLTQPAQRPNSIDEPLSTARLREQFDKLKVWQNRRPIFLQAIHRFTYRQLYSIIQQLADLERQAKQTFDDNVWQQLSDLAAKISR